MNKVLVSLVMLLPVSIPAAAQKTPAPTPGIGVSTSSAPPPGAKKAEIQDLRVLEKGPDDPYELERFGLGAVQAKDLVHARSFFEMSWKYGELPTAAYNLACVDAREGKTGAALAQLEKAVGVGFDDEKTLLGDPDIAALRTQARFSGVLASARKNRSAGDAAVVSEGTFVAPQGRPVGILVVLHDRSSDPVAASGPFVNAALGRGLFVAVPRGPARAGKKRFGWGTKERALSAVAAALAEAKRRAGANLPVLLVGIGRGGTLAFTVAAHQAGTYSGVGSVGGPYDAGAGNTAQAPAEAAALRGTRLFFGVTYDAPQGLVAEMGRGVDALKRVGLNPVFRNWPGAGETFPQNVAGAVKDTLDGMMGIR